MPLDDRDRVRDMLDRARRVRSIVAGLEPEQFLEDELVSTTVTHHLQDIGEAARCLSLETREQTPSVPWRSLIGMRNVIVHEYMRIDFALVWSAATEHVPTLIEVMDAWLDERGEAEGTND